MAVIKATDAQIEAAAKQAYMNNRAGTTDWHDVSEKHKSEWRYRVRSVVEAAINVEQ